jgi:ubiquitin
MVLWVKGPNRYFTLNVEPTDRIEDVKDMIHEREGMAPGEQRLIYKGRQLEEGNTLQSYSLRNDSTIHFVIRLRG